MKKLLVKQAESNKFSKIKKLGHDRQRNARLDINLNSGCWVVHIIIDDDDLENRTRKRNRQPCSFLLFLVSISLLFVVSLFWGF